MAEAPKIDLAEHLAARKAWETKPVMRTVYRHLFRAILKETVPGSILEIGGGAGRLKEFRPDIICTDLHSSPYVDLTANAEALPFTDNSLDNIVMLDVFHHIPRPRKALEEAERVLRTGGRLIMLEPSITLGSYLFYRHFHPEPVNMRADPLGEAALSTEIAYDSNQAIPTLLLREPEKRLKALMPHLRVTKTRWMSFLAYPLSGGLRPWSLLPNWLAPLVLFVEDQVPGAIGKIFGFRVLIVFEKIHPE